MATEVVDSRVGGGKATDTKPADTKPAESKDQQSGKCEATCGANTAKIGENTASGTGSTSVSSNHIIQYPRQPRQDDGKWMALGSLLGAVLGKFADNGTIRKAKDAENKWKDINAKLAQVGNELFDKMPGERAKADKADADLENQYNWNMGQRDNELARAEKLDNCNDSLHEQVCEFASCGYKPDYDGITARIKADVASQIKQKREEMCKTLNRYNARACCAIETALATTGIATTVSALYKAREDERSRAWQIKEGLLFKATELMERDRTNRAKLASDYDTKGINIQQHRWTAHNGNYFDLAKLGGDFLSSAGKNYAWLAESYRKTADKMSGSLANLGALIALALTILTNVTNGEAEKC